MGVTVDSKKFTPDSLVDDINKVLNTPSFAESASKVSRVVKDTPRKPTELAADWIEYAIRHDGAMFHQIEGLQQSWSVSGRVCLGRTCHVCVDSVCVCVCVCVYLCLCLCQVWRLCARFHMNVFWGGGGTWVTGHGCAAVCCRLPTLCFPDGDTGGPPRMRAGLSPTGGMYSWPSSAQSPCSCTPSSSVAPLCAANLPLQANRTRKPSKAFAGAQLFNLTGDTPQV